jgi:hypothetical protein
MAPSRLRTAVSVCRLLPWFLAFGVLKRFVALPTLARWSWRAPKRKAATPDAARIAAYVLRAGALAGVPDRDCLQRSLLLYRELSGAGLGPELAVGFQQENGGVTGHAWVSVRGAVIGERDLDQSRFAPILRFGERGTFMRDASPG